MELLAPAKNLECGIAAIDHGADAVYIGAPMFGARASAGNSLEDIAQLAAYAHQFNAKVYVALNTILTDKELKDAELLINDLYYKAKVDALIIQDMGITMLNLPPIPLHASTQTDNRDIEKIKFLESSGFQQIVLARELTISEIKKIADEVQTPLEVFVHGALCVCYSGQCYLSQALSNRSANKGSCAQMCRLPFTVFDANGEQIMEKKHLLSIKDLNLSEHLEELIDAGVSSLKIEGRMKDVSYVKNVVAYYRQKLDAILARRTEYVKASSGRSTYLFEPDLAKSFNRGFTDYFAHDRTKDMWSIDSPKSIGEPIGKITDVTAKYIKVKTTKELHNGDGLCFYNKANELEGIQVNRAEGELVYPATMPDVRPGVLVYRNHDHEFEKLLNKKSAERKIDAAMELNEISSGFSVEIKDEDGNHAILNFEHTKEEAQKDQAENISKNLSKTGNTLFNISNVNINYTSNWFIPSSTISEWRRQIIDKLTSDRSTNFCQPVANHQPSSHAFPVQNLTYLGNVMNEKSRQFYLSHQTSVLQPAFEKEKQHDVPLMFTRHCVKYSLGWCPKEKVDKHPYTEPFYLTHNNTRLRLSFDCKACEMKVFLDRKTH